MSADLLLSKLDGVKPTGSGRWMALCPAHQDKRPSLSVRELDDGRVLVHCFSHGCSAHEIVSAVGLEISDLFPPRPSDPAHIGKPERRPFPATDIVMRRRLVEPLLEDLALLHAIPEWYLTLAIAKTAGLQRVPVLGRLWRWHPSQATRTMRKQATLERKAIANLFSG